MAGKKGKRAPKGNFEASLQTMVDSEQLDVVFHSTLPLLAVRSPDNRIFVFDATTSQLLQNFPTLNLEATTTCIAWSHSEAHTSSEQNGTSEGSKKPVYIGIGLNDGKVIVLDYKKGEVLHELSKGTSSSVTALAFAQGNRLFSSTLDGNIQEWNLQSGQLNRTLKVDKAVTRLTLDQEGTMLATASLGIKVWDLASSRVLKKFHGHSNRVSDLQFSPDGNFIVSAANDRFVNVYSIHAENEEPLRVLTNEAAITKVSFNNKQADQHKRKRSEAETSNQYKYHVSGLSQNGTLILWEFSNNKTAATPEQPICKIVSDLKYGEILASCFTSITELFVSFGSYANPSFQKLRYVKESGEIVPSLRVSVKPESTEQKKPKNAVKGIKPGKGIVQSGDIVVDRAVPSQMDSSSSSSESDNKTLQEKLEQITKIKEQKSAAIPAPPKADSLQAVLVQALHSKDRRLLESCVSISDTTIIQNTVRRLPPQYVLPFLNFVLEKFQNRPSRGAAMILWLKAVLVIHTSYLLTVPSMAQSLSSLYQTLNSQARVFKKILNLSGRLNLMMTQISARNKEEDTLNDTSSATIYHEDDDDEDDEDNDEDFDEDEGEGSDKEGEETHMGNGVEEAEGEEEEEEGAGEGEESEGEEEAEEDEEEAEEDEEDEEAGEDEMEE